MQLDAVRGVAINLIRGQMDEWGLGTEASQSLEQVERPTSIHVEIVKGSLGGQIMAGLGSRVNHSVGSQPLDQRQQIMAVADINLMVYEVAERDRHMLLVPAC